MCGEYDAVVLIQEPTGADCCATTTAAAATTSTIILLLLVTFCVSRRRRKMYCGHARLCVCLRPYAHTTARTQM